MGHNNPLEKDLDAERKPASERPALPKHYPMDGAGIMGA